MSMVTRNETNQMRSKNKNKNKNNFKRGFRQPRNKHAIAIQSIDRIEVANTKGLITVYVSMKPISSLFDVYAPTSGAHSDNTVIGDFGSWQIKEEAKVKYEKL